MLVVMEVVKLRFIVSGRELELTSEGVERAVSGTEPGRLYKLAVEINDQLFPVKQAFQVAAGCATGDEWDILDFTSAEARRVLRALGFHVQRITGR